MAKRQKSKNVSPPALSFKRGPGVSIKTGVIPIPPAPSLKMEGVTLRVWHLNLNIGYSA